MYSQGLYGYIAYCSYLVMENVAEGLLQSVTSQALTASNTPGAIKFKVGVVQKAPEGSPV